MRHHARHPLFTQPGAPQPRRWAAALASLLLAGPWLAGPAAAAYVTSSATVYGAMHWHDSNTGVIRSEAPPGGSARGSTDSGVNLSESFASLYSDAGDSVYGPAYGDAYGRADLASGSLHARVNTIGFLGLGGMTARWDDSITFNTAHAGASTARQVLVDLHLSGLYAPDAAFAGTNINYNWTFNMGRTSGESTSGGDLWWLVENDFVGFKHTPNGWADWTLLSGTLDDVHLRGTLNLVGPSSTYNISTELSLTCTRGADCDFGHSARLGLVLPPDVSFTSGSGVLLSAAAVPEPATSGLMTLGLGVLLLAGRRRPAGPVKRRGAWAAHRGQDAHSR